MNEDVTTERVGDYIVFRFWKDKLVTSMVKVSIAQAEKITALLDQHLYDYDVENTAS